MVEVEVTRMEETSKSKELKAFGKFTRFVFENGSKIYVHKKGWTIAHPKYMNKDLTLNWGEINLAIEETKRLGYTTKIIDNKIR